MERTNGIKLVALTGIVGNVFLMFIKLIVGFATGTQAMIADGANSASDIFCSLMTYIGNRISGQPGDSDHPYGHGKAEYLFSMIISMSLIVVAAFVFRSSLEKMFSDQHFRYSFWLVVIAVISIVLKLGMYFVTIDAAQKYDSLLAFANATDHRNDILISLLTLFSIVMGYFQIYFFDAVFGMIIAIWIARSGFSIFASSYHVLMDTTLSGSITRQMRRKVESVDGVEHLDSLVSKPLGVKYLLIVKVSVDGNLTVFRGHDISYQIKHQLKQFKLVDDVIVHLNPVQHHPQKNLLK